MIDEFDEPLARTVRASFDAALDVPPRDDLWTGMAARLREPRPLRLSHLDTALLAAVAASLLASPAHFVLLMWCL
jgi:hypothetical protein